MLEVSNKPFVVPQVVKCASWGFVGHTITKDTEKVQLQYCRDCQPWQSVWKVLFFTTVAIGTLSGTMCALHPTTSHKYAFSSAVCMIAVLLVFHVILTKLVDYVIDYGSLTVNSECLLALRGNLQIPVGSIVNVSSIQWRSIAGREAAANIHVLCVEVEDRNLVLFASRDALLHKAIEPFLLKW